MWTVFTGCMKCRCSLAMTILSVCLSVFLSVRRVNCDKTEEKSVHISIPYERSFSLVYWEKERLVGRSLLPEIWGQPTRVVAKSPLLNRYSLVTHSEKSSINTNRKSTAHFPMSQTWLSYVALKPPPQREAQKRKVYNIWAVSCDNSETVHDWMSVTINH